MEFGSRLIAICFTYVGFIQVVASIDITIQPSSEYYVVSEPLTFTCTFDTTATAVRILQKNGVKVQSVQLSGSDCYNVELAVPQICDPSFCSCSQQGNIFTASWNITISSTSLWKCVEGSSQSQELLIKPAVPFETVTLTKESQLYAGEETTFTCVTNECRPRAYVQWYIGSENYTLVQSATVEVTNSTEDLTYVESKLKVILKLDFDNQMVKCLAWNIRPTTYVTTNDTINVQGPTTTRHPPDTTLPSSDLCSCPVLFCIGEIGFCILWIIVIVACVLLIIVLSTCFCCCQRRKKGQNEKSK